MRADATVARALLQRTLTEATLQATIVDTAKLRDWHVAHFRPAKTSRGYRTPIEGHAGFPDLVLARRGVVFVWELKGWEGGRRPRLGEPTLEQLAWLDAIRDGVADARVVYPDDLDAALRALELGRWPT